jgi:hypothetical protein
MKIYTANVQYVPELSGDGLMWSWNAQIREHTSMPQPVTRLDPGRSFYKKEDAKENARRIISLYLNAINENNYERLTIEVE